MGDFWRDFSAVISEDIISKGHLEDVLAELDFPSSRSLLDLPGMMAYYDYVVFNDFYVRMKGSIADKSENVLKLLDKPLTAEQINSFIGEGHADRTIQTVLSTEKRFIRIDKNQRYALVDSHFEKYEGIFQEICKRIESNGGQVSVRELIDELPPKYGVKEGSVIAYLENKTFSVTDGLIRYAEDYVFISEHPSTIQTAVETPDGWGQFFVLMEDNFKGYSFNLSSHIAYHNGIRVGDSLEVPVDVSKGWEAQASIIWRKSSITDTVDIGRLRRLLERDFRIGDEIIIVPKPEKIRIFRPSEFEGSDLRADERLAKEIGSWMNLPNS